MRVAGDRQVYYVSVKCQGKTHEVGLMAGGAIVPASHTRAEWRDLLAAAKLGDPCGCVTFIRQKWTADAVATAFGVPEVASQYTARWRLWRRAHRRHGLRPCPAFTESPVFESATRLKAAIRAELAAGPGLADAAIALVSVETNDRLRVREGLLCHVQDASTGGRRGRRGRQRERAGGYPVDDRTAAGPAVDEVVRVAEAAALRQRTVAAEERDRVRYKDGAQEHGRLAALTAWAASHRRENVSATVSAPSLTCTVDTVEKAGPAVTPSPWTSGHDRMTATNGFSLTLTLQAMPLVAAGRVQAILDEAVEKLQRLVTACQVRQRTRYRFRPEDQTFGTPTTAWAKNWWNGRVHGTDPRDL